MVWLGGGSVKVGGEKKEILGAFPPPFFLLFWVWEGLSDNNHKSSDLRKESYQLMGNYLFCIHSSSYAPFTVLIGSQQFVALPLMYKTSSSLKR